MSHTDARTAKPDDEELAEIIVKLRYLTIEGVRYLVKHIRTVKPGLNESSRAFRERMDRFAERLSTRPFVRLVEHDFERRNKKDVLCEFEITYEPHIPEVLPVDDTPAGGRHGNRRHAA